MPRCWVLYACAGPKIILMRLVVPGACCEQITSATRKSHERSSYMSTAAFRSIFCWMPWMRPAMKSSNLQISRSDGCQILSGASHNPLQPSRNWPVPRIPVQAALLPWGRAGSKQDTQERHSSRNFLLPEIPACMPTPTQARGRILRGYETPFSPFGRLGSGMAFTQSKTSDSWIICLAQNCLSPQA